MDTTYQELHQEKQFIEEQIQNIHKQITINPSNPFLNSLEKALVIYQIKLNNINNQLGIR